MKYQEVTVPMFAEGATVIRLRQWLRREGEKVNTGENLAEATTDKIAIYIEAPFNGYMHKILVSEGEVVQVGQVIALMVHELSEEV